jgi:predicted dehydrogenase
LKAAFIGCGLIGQKRAEALGANLQIVGCFDLDTKKSEAFAKAHNCGVYESEMDLVNDKSVDLVVIATQHNSLARIAIECLNRNKHVFLEKPGACYAQDLARVSETARKNLLNLHIGYNHQFHPAILKMNEIVRNGRIGDLMFVRIRYGHGGRVGYEKEWRSKKEISGGGELIDQGSHLIDLVLKLFGDLRVSYAATPTYFWNMQVEDNAFVVLEDIQGRISFLHASCTEWKNLFSMEVYGTKAKIEVVGLGRSYGAESLTLYEMLPEMGPPKVTKFTFDEPDLSWKLELEQFISDIEQKTYISDNSQTSIRVLQIIEEIYQRTGR